MTPDERAEAKKRADKLEQEILLGRYDGHLPDLIAACKVRGTLPDGPALHWKVEAAGVTVTSENVSLLELEQVQISTGAGWAISPEDGPRACAALLLAALCVREGLDYKQARERLKEAGADAVLRSVSFYEQADPPLVHTEPET